VLSCGGWIVSGHSAKPGGARLQRRPRPAGLRTTIALSSKDCGIGRSQVAPGRVPVAQATGSQTHRTFRFPPGRHHQPRPSSLAGADAMLGGSARLRRTHQMRGPLPPKEFGGEEAAPSPAGVTFGADRLDTAASSAGLGCIEVAGCKSSQPARAPLSPRRAATECGPLGGLEGHRGPIEAHRRSARSQIKAQNRVPMRLMLRTPMAVSRRLRVLDLQIHSSMSPAQLLLRCEGWRRVSCAQRWRGCSCSLSCSRHQLAWRVTPLSQGQRRLLGADPMSCGSFWSIEPHRQPGHTARSHSWRPAIAGPGGERLTGTLARSLGCRAA